LPAAAIDVLHFHAEGCRFSAAASRHVTGFRHTGFAAGHLRFRNISDENR